MVIGRQVKSDRVGNGFLGVGWIHRKLKFMQEDKPAGQRGLGGWAVAGIGDSRLPAQRRSLTIHGQMVECLRSVVQPGAFI